MLPDHQLKFLLALLKLHLISPRIWKNLNQTDDWKELWQGKRLRHLLTAEKQKIFDQRKQSVKPEAELRKIQTENIQTIYYKDDNYSAFLREIASPPILLFAKGNPQLLGQACLSVIGSRRATPYSQNALEQLLDQEILEKYVIVSGFAHGIDSLAHQRTLAMNGKTIGVLGYGFRKNYCYPAANHALWKNMEHHGLLISEFYPEENIVKQDFACRNRIIAGLSQAVLIIQAREKSGSLITADLALQFNRDILVVPSRLNDDNFLGSHQLIQNGAKLIHSLQDLKNQLPLLNRIGHNTTTTSKQLSMDEQNIINLLYKPKTIDELLEMQPLKWENLIELLQNMEIQKLIKKAGAYYYI
jgi:DNA processing protein